MGLQMANLYYGDLDLAKVKESFILSLQKYLKSIGKTWDFLQKIKK